MLRIAPKLLNAVDMILAAIGKRLAVVQAMVFSKTVQGIVAPRLRLPFCLPTKLAIINFYLALELVDFNLSYVVDLLAQMLIDAGNCLISTTRYWPSGMPAAGRSQ
jgi:hypothetical protein